MKHEFDNIIAVFSDGPGPSENQASFLEARSKPGEDNPRKATSEDWGGHGKDNKCN